MKIMEELHNAKIETGKYRGELWTRLPLAYVKFLANSSQGSQQAIALAELERRGIDPGKDGYGIDVTMHSVDRASQKLLHFWNDRRIGDEGLATWMARTALEAIEKGRYHNGRYEFEGIRYVIKKGYLEPVLASIYPVTAEEKYETENT